MLIVKTTYFLLLFKTIRHYKITVYMKLGVTMNIKRMNNFHFVLPFASSTFLVQLDNIFLQIILIEPYIYILANIFC